MFTHCIISDLKEGEGEKGHLPLILSQPILARQRKRKRKRKMTDETCVIPFVELKVLIESGREDLILNNKFILDALNMSSQLDAPPSQSTVPLKKKLWELTAPYSSTTVIKKMNVSRVSFKVTSDIK
ncbi:hypothetical protein L208DRAFT_1377871 [Tricholoma matsutake]|nr:hypothetical protein L208DRAFT_1377871 [Tricholoma matsutake 945]